MEYKFTKGKWEADEDHVASLDQKTHGNIICVIPEHFYPDSRENWEYNALLISKSPEMLNLLKELYPILMDRLLFESGNKVIKLIKEATEL